MADVYEITLRAEFGEEQVAKTAARAVVSALEIMRKQMPGSSDRPVTIRLSRVLMEEEVAELWPARGST